MDKLIARLTTPNDIIGGVSATMAGLFAWSCLWTRLVWVLLALLHPASVLPIYVILALILANRNANP